MKKTNLKAFSVRLDAELLEQARALGVDVAETFRMKLEQAVRMKQHKCPMCGQRPPRGQKGWERV